MVHTKEIWDASVYDKANGQQFRDADEMIKTIIDDNLGEVDIILDIGCGSGNVTKMLSSRIPHKKMYAFDFDAQMVEYANETYNDGTIEYFVQSIDVPWDDLDERLKKLEGKIDIIWSNRVLHWIKDKKRAVNTIGRLLKKNGGRCYVNITLIRDLNEFATEEEKKENVKYISQPSHKQTLDNWTEYFNQCGLTKVSVNMLLKKWVYESAEELDSIEESASILLTKTLLLRKDVPKDEIEGAVQKYSRLLKKSFQSKYGDNYLAEDSKHDGLSVYYEQFRILGVKE
jgi:trans-aconitate methyltransferase